MSYRPLLLILLLLSAFSQSGCILPSFCDPDSEYYDEGICNNLLFLYIKYATEAAYGEQEALPSSEGSGGCYGLRCQGGPCRQVLDNGNFERKNGLGLEGFFGTAVHTDRMCLGDVGANLETEGGTLSQWVVLEEVLTPGEMQDVQRIRVRARVWLNTASPNGKEGILRLVAATGSSQETTLLTRETSLSTDADTDTWEPVETAMTLPAGTDHVRFEIEARSASLLADYAQVVLDYGNRAPVASDQSGTLPEDGQWVFFPNASDPDGSLNLLSLQTSPPQHGTLNDRIYTPPPDFTGEDRFTYSIADDRGFFSNEATVTLRVVPVNDAPVAANDAYDVPDGPLLLVPTPLGVLANDIDVEGDTLRAVLVDDVRNGTLSLDADGGFSYTPDAGFTGTDAFTYRATDGPDTSAVATVTLSREATGYDLAVEKSASPTTVQQGRQVTFTVVVTNDGPGDAAGIRVRDRMTQFVFELDNSQTSQGSFSFDVVTASGVWDVGSLAAGQSATLTLTGYLDDSATNTATITDGLGDGDDGGNNEDRASVTVQ